MLLPLLVAFQQDATTFACQLKDAATHISRTQANIGTTDLDVLDQHQSANTTLRPPPVSSSTSTTAHRHQTHQTQNHPRSPQAEAVAGTMAATATMLSSMAPARSGMAVTMPTVLHLPSARAEPPHVFNHHQPHHNQEDNVTDHRGRSEFRSSAPPADWSPSSFQCPAYSHAPSAAEAGWAQGEAEGGRGRGRSRGTLEQQREQPREQQREQELGEADGRRRHYRASAANAAVPAREHANPQAYTSSTPAAVAVPSEMKHSYGYGSHGGCSGGSTAAGSTAAGRRTRTHAHASSASAHTHPRVLSPGPMDSRDLYSTRLDEAGDRDGFSN